MTSQLSDIKIISKVMSCVQSIYFVALLYGIVLSTAFYPMNFFLAIPCALSGFLFLIFKCDTIKQRFITGFSFGFGHFTTSLYWMSYALLVEVEKFGWLIPINLIVIPSIISMLTGMFAVIIGFFKASRINTSIAFASLWVLFEVLRSHLLLPFPWNLLGYASSFSLEFMQLASVVGVYGLSFILALSGAIYYSRNIKFIIFVSTICLVGYVYGAYRIKQPFSIDHATPIIRIVQPDIREHHLGDIQKQLESLETLFTLSTSEGYDKIQAIIWPEASFPFIADNSALRDLGKLVSSDGALILGTDRVDQDNQVYNSIIVIQPDGTVSFYYDKQILVPFGEFIPMRQFIPFVDKIAYGIGDFKAGTDNQSNLQFAGIKAMPFICYEGIFTIPFFGNGEQIKDADVLLNVTNDIWFRDSVGPYQHFAMARMRAIEYGRPMLRAANTGISGVIDSYGQILQSAELYSQKVLDARIPPKLQTETMYLKLYKFIIPAIGGLFFLSLKFDILFRIYLAIKNRFKSM